MKIILSAIYIPKCYILMSLKDKDSKDDFPYVKILHIRIINIIYPFTQQIFHRC